MSFRAWRIPAPHTPFPSSATMYVNGDTFHGLAVSAIHPSASSKAFDLSVEARGEQISSQRDFFDARPAAGCQGRSKPGETWRGQASHSPQPTTCLRRRQQLRVQRAGAALREVGRVRKDVPLRDVAHALRGRRGVASRSLVPAAVLAMTNSSQKRAARRAWQYFRLAHHDDVVERQVGEEGAIRHQLAYSRTPAPGEGLRRCRA